MSLSEEPGSSQDEDEEDNFSDTLGAEHEHLDEDESEPEKSKDVSNAVIPWNNDLAHPKRLLSYLWDVDSLVGQPGLRVSNEDLEQHYKIPALCQIKTPFLPFEVNKADLRSFKSSQAFAQFEKRIGNLTSKGSRHVVPHQRNLKSQIIKGVWSTSTKRSKEVRDFERNYTALLREYPFGPDPTCSSLQKFTHEGALLLAYTNNSNALQIRRLSPTFDDERGLFDYVTEKDFVSEIVDYTMGDSKVVGFSVLPDESLFSLRYRNALSLVELHGQPVSRWRSERDLLCSARLSKNDVVSVDVAGSVHLHNCDFEAPRSTWREALMAAGPLDWMTLLPDDDNPRLLRAATRQQALLLDLRMDSVCQRTLLLAGDSAAICALSQSKQASSNLYCVTSEALHLLDARRDSVPLQTTTLNSDSKGLIVGCESEIVDDQEYIVTYRSNGEVQLMAEDWRSVRADAPSLLGRPVDVPSVPELLASSSRVVEPRARNLLRVPWTGLALNAHSRGLAIFAASAVGTLFGCDLRPHDDGLHGLEGRVATDWLADGHRTRARKLEEEGWIASWAEEWHNSDFQKINTAQSVFNRTSDNKLKGLVAKRKRRSLRKSPLKPKEPKNVVYAACPFLSPFDPTEYNDANGRKVAQLFEDKSLSAPELDATRPFSVFSQESEGPSLSQFQDDLHAAVTSTQQSEFEPSATSSQATDSVSKVFAKKTPKKRKSTFQAGF